MKSATDFVSASLLESLLSSRRDMRGPLREAHADVFCNPVQLRPRENTEDLDLIHETRSPAYLTTTILSVFVIVRVLISACTR